MHAQGKCLAAIDVGSTTTRCVLFDLQGRSIGESYREPPVHHPQTDWSEVEPEDWWTCASTVTREALQRSGISSDQVLGVGLCGLKHALVPLDAYGEPLARAMLWMDQRCLPQAEWLAHEHGDLIEEVMGEGRTVSTTPSAPKLRWIVENDPDLLQRTHTFLLPKDFVRFRLTGKIGTDPSDAGGTRLYDPRRGDWCEPLLAGIGVPREKLPPIYPATHIAGRVTPRAAQATGLAQGTPVVVGGGDVRSTLIGANAFHTQQACLYLGTSAWISVHPAAGGDHTEDENRPLAAQCFGATSTTGAALKWLRQLLQGKWVGSPSDSYAALLQEAERSPIGARGLILLPHLMGERGPGGDPCARGTLFGLTLAHGKGDIARAFLEGCAYQLRHIVEGLPDSGLKEIVVVGGGARSMLWLQIIADVFGVPLLVPRIPEAGALGAAILAGVGLGVYPNERETASSLVEIVQRIQPDVSRHESYDRFYALFAELESRVAPLYRSVPSA
jgi:xylulokinase